MFKELITYEVAATAIVEGGCERLIAVCESPIEANFELELFRATTDEDMSEYKSYVIRKVTKSLPVIN